MPRTAFVDPTVILDVLKKYEIFDENHNVRCRSHKVWKDACTEISDKLSPNTLNFYVRNNRWDLKTSLKQHFNTSLEENVIDSINISNESDSRNITNESDSINITNESDITQEYQPYDFPKNVNTKLPKFCFNLALSDEQWKSIFPVSKLYKEKGRHGKAYKILKIGWTDVISKACFLKSTLPCAYTFKYGKVFDSPEAETYLKVYGFYGECRAEFRAHCLYEPAPDTGIVLRIHTVDFWNSA